MLQALSLPSELTIYTVGELHPRWLAWLGAARQAQADGALPDGLCQVDATAVDEIDAAGIQLVAALHHGLAQERLSLQLTRPSGPLTSACNALGMQYLLGDAQPEAQPIGVTA